MAASQNLISNKAYFRDFLKAKSTQYIVFFVLLFPLLIDLWMLYHDKLGINPIEEITHGTGEWSLRFLLITLAISPMRRIFKFNDLVYLRRPLGLVSFAYALAHFCIYLILDQWFDVMAIVEDVIERPYITVGFSAFILMLPLAITSTSGMRIRLQHLWITLHRLIYVIAILAVLHFLWLVKADIFEPLIYASILAFLLAYRVYVRLFVACSTNS